MTEIDPETGREWGVGEFGFDHNRPHEFGDDCPLADNCSLCFGWHCAWYCDDK